MGGPFSCSNLENSATSWATDACALRFFTHSTCSETQKTKRTGSHVFKSVLKQQSGASDEAQNVQPKIYSKGNMRLQQSEEDKPSGYLYVFSMKFSFYVELHRTDGNTSWEFNFVLKRLILEDIHLF